MPIDTITPFTPLASTLGGVLIGLSAVLVMAGVLIGLSAVLVMALFGRIAGISGITTGAVPASRDDWDWRIAFVFGLIAAPILVLGVTGETITQSVPDNLPMMVLAGLLVGLGTVTGSGCTSGHGVCGLARLSARSLVAVVTFMAFAVATVFVLRHLL